MSRWLVMVAGPYRSGAADAHGRREHLRALERAAYEVFRKGHVPLVGVNVALPLVEVAGKERYDEIMTPLCLRLADRCDAVLRVGGPSAGADAEVERIRDRGGRVLHSLDELPEATGDGSA